MSLKKYYAFGDDKPPIYYRPGTSDEAIIQANIIDRNEYLFPHFKPAIVYDIGGNIGIVAAILANIYPDSTIYSFEPIEANFEILLKNVESYGNVVAKPFGLGAEESVRRIWPSDDPLNFGGFSMEIQPQVNKEPAQKCTIRAMSEVCQIVGPPDLIKIDVEGAEYDILTSMTDAQLSHLKWIAGELHGHKDFLLLEFLKARFNIKVQRDFGDVVYHFHAIKRNWTPTGP